MLNINSVIKKYFQTHLSGKLKPTAKYLVSNLKYLKSVIFNNKLLLSHMSRVIFHELKQLKNGDLHIELFFFAKCDLEDKDIEFIIKCRDTALVKKTPLFLFSPSFVEIKKGKSIAKFIVPLENLIIDGELGLVVQVWDCFLYTDKEHSVKCLKKLDSVFKKNNYDFVPYATVNNNFSLIGVRNKSTVSLPSYHKSISFVLFRIHYRGGVTKVTIDLANALAERGYKVTLIAIDMVDISNSFPISSKVNFDYVSLPVHRGGLISFDPYSKKMDVDPLLNAQINRYFSCIEVDIVYIPVYGPALFLILIEAMSHDVIKVIGDHSSRRYRVYDRVLKNKKKPSLELLLRLTTDEHYFRNIKKASAVHVINPLVKPMFEQVTENIILDIPNIVSTQQHENIAWRKREKIIIGVGSLTKVKKFDALIKAFGSVYQAFPDWVLEIYGEGVERVALETLIEALSLSDRVFLKGFSADISHQFQRSMIHVSVSSAESFGLTMVEAMSARTITVSTYMTIGAKYLIEDEKTGFMALDNSVINVAQRIGDVIKLIEADDPIVFEVRNSAYCKSHRYNAENISKEWSKSLELLRV